MSSHCTAHLTRGNESGNIKELYTEAQTTCVLVTVLFFTHQSWCACSLELQVSSE